MALPPSCVHAIFSALDDRSSAIWLASLYQMMLPMVTIKHLFLLCE